MHVYVCVCVCVCGMTLILNISLLLPDMSCRSRLATLNEKLTALERRIEYIEARVSMTGEMLPHEARQWLCKRGYTFLLLAKTNLGAEIV